MSSLNKQHEEPAKATIVKKMIPLNEDLSFSSVFFNAVKCSSNYIALVIT